MTHAPTHKKTNTPKLSAPLPAILAGLFILAGCGGTALPTNGQIETPTSADVANKADINAGDSIFLSVGEEPPEVAAKSAPPAITPPITPIAQVPKQVPKQEPKQEQEQEPKQVQIPAPVFEVAVAPASPPQRSFSQSQPEPQTSTETVTRSDATGESNHDDGKITFADWTGSFAGTLPSRATTTATTTTQDTVTKYNGGILVTFTGKSLVNKVDDTILTYTSEVLKANGEAHADGDRIAFTTDADGYIIVTSKDGLPMFSESEMVYIATNVKLNGDIQVIMDNPLPDITTISGTRNQFLQGLRGNLDERPFEEDGRVALVNIRDSLNLATATHGGDALGGDAADGVAFFRGFGEETVDSRTTIRYSHNYAGLLSGTDLGKPLGLTFRGETSANWNGHFRSIGYYDFDTDFILNVNFSTRKLNVSEFDNPHPERTKQHFIITDASYTTEGVISGTIIFDEDDDLFSIENEYGFLTGLIGAQGAVAAFLSSGYENDQADDATQIERTEGTKETIVNGFHEFGFAGGFVARPAPVVEVVDASDLPNYATIPTAIAGLSGANRGFLRIADGTELVTTGVTDARIFTDIRDYTAGSTGFGDGYALIYQTGYAAMLPTTDLGAALPVGSGEQTDARWEGAYSLTSSLGLLIQSPITFEINFATSFLTGSADIPLDAGKTITIAAGFDGTGVINGGFSTDSASPINTGSGTVIGLIGEEGLVGIMHGVNTAGTDFAGGFVASP